MRMGAGRLVLVEPGTQDNGNDAHGPPACGELPSSNIEHVTGALGLGVSSASRIDSGTSFSPAKKLQPAPTSDGCEGTGASRGISARESSPVTGSWSLQLEKKTVSPAGCAARLGCRAGFEGTSGAASTSPDMRGQGPVKEHSPGISVASTSDSSAGRTGMPPRASSRTDANATPLNSSNAPCCGEIGHPRAERPEGMGNCGTAGLPKLGDATSSSRPTQPILMSSGTFDSTCLKLPSAIWFAWSKVVAACGLPWNVKRLMVA